MSLSLPEEEGTILMGMTGGSDSGKIKQNREKEVREASSYVNISSKAN